LVLCVAALASSSGPFGCGDCRNVCASCRHCIASLISISRRLGLSVCSAARAHSSAWRSYNRAKVGTARSTARMKTRHASPQPNPIRLSRPAGIRFTGPATVAANARRWPQCTKHDPGAALRPQTPQSFDCLDAASPSRIHSSACLRSISRAKGSSAFSAAWRQSLAWCSHNSTCDDIGPTSCGHLMPAGAQVAQFPAGMPIRRAERRVRSKPIPGLLDCAGGAEKSLASAAKWDTKAPRGVFTLWSKRNNQRAGEAGARGRAYCVCA